jgi:STAS-like domain of unknown function (DUF4325)
MLAAGQLSVEGRGPATRYRAGAPSPAVLHERAWPLAGLDEDRAWTVAWAALTAKDPAVSEPARSLLRYGFTEMVNNAMDHSGAREVVTRLGMTPSGRVYFEVIDRGVGALENIRRTLGLADHLEAMQQLSKGKLSTQPERHSGEGLFFTSKAADHFELIANGLRWVVDKARADQALGQAAETPGTHIRFEIQPDTHERLEDLFARYTHDFEFDTTRAVIKLFAYGTSFVSRSEAKRLTRGLEQFRHVILDFQDVTLVGQGFADEIFRVWSRAHPQIELQAENMIPPVAFMVERARTAAGNQIPK